MIVADAGYWHQEQMDELVSRGMQVLIPPDAKKRKGARAGWTGGAYALDADRALPRTRARALQPPLGDDRAGVRGWKHNRKIDRTNEEVEPPCSPNGG